MKLLKIPIPYQISTHTPHARCDVAVRRRPWACNISTHTPHARCDPLRLRVCFLTLQFLLTHLMRGVTPILLKILPN